MAQGRTGNGVRGPPAAVSWFYGTLPGEAKFRRALPDFSISESPSLVNLLEKDLSCKFSIPYSYLGS